MDAKTAIDALAAGLANAGLTEAELTRLGEQAGRGLDWTDAIAKRGEAEAKAKEAATLNDQANALETKARKLAIAPIKEV